MTVSSLKSYADLTGVCQHPRNDPERSTGDAAWPSRSFPQLPAAACRHQVGASRTSRPHRPYRLHLPNRAQVDGPMAPSLEAIVKIAHEEGHSDVHLGCRRSTPLSSPRRDAEHRMAGDRSEHFQGWLGRSSPQQIDAFFREKEFDGSHAFPFVRIRINLLDSLRGAGDGAAADPPDDPHDGAAEAARASCGTGRSRPKGLILVTGPTGSGKSTTLAAMIDWINRNETRHILTIEDPVEFVHESKQIPDPTSGSGHAHPQIPQRPAGRAAGGP